MNLKTTTLTVTGALLLALGTTTSSDAALQNRYAVGNFEITLDGLGAAFVSSVDGGTMVSEAVVEPGSRGTFVKKKPSAPRFEPLIVEVNLTAAPKAWIDWVNGSINGTERPKNGALAILDHNYSERQRRSYSNLRLAELTLEKLDAKDAKKPLNIELDFVADSVTETKGTGQQNPTAVSNRGKSASASNFRITMPGLDTSRVSSVGPITVKLVGGGTPSKGVDALMKGEQRNNARAEVMPFTMRLSEGPTADAWKAWYQSFVVQGKNTDAEEKTMTIELLDPSLKTVLFRARLEGVGIVALAPGTLEANKENSTELQADLYAESFKLDPPGK